MGYGDYKILLDQPSGAPALGFIQYASALQDIIERSDPQFAIGIFGGWGSGKTTLMQMIEKQLDPQRVIPVQFSAWRYEKEQHLIIPLLDTVRAALVTWAATPATAAESGATARRTASTIGKVMRSILAGLSLKVGVPEVIEASWEANKTLAWRDTPAPADLDAAVPRSFYHASFQALNEAFSEFVGGAVGRRIVVFIDDLDRCLPDGALDVLESMKLFFDLHGFVFVVGLDRQVVEACIDSKYQQAQAEAAPEDGAGYRVRGADYIKKLFQVPFSLPPVPPAGVEEFVFSISAEAALPVDQVDDLHNRILPHLRYVVTGTGVNPREIKRYINAYILLMKVKQHLDPNKVLALQTITFRPDWRQVREALYIYREAFIDAVNREHGGERNALEGLDEQYRSIPQSFLDYTAPGSPGASLLTPAPLDEYIYSGESTRSTLSPHWLDLVRDVAKVRQAADAAAIAEGDGVSTADGQLKERMAIIVSRVREVAHGPGSGIITRNVEALREQVERLPVPGGRAAWREEFSHQVRQTLTHLMDFLQKGDVATA